MVDLCGLKRMKRKRDRGRTRDGYERRKRCRTDEVPPILETCRPDETRGLVLFNEARAA